MNDASPTASNKFRRYRERKKAQGLREIRMWVPDVNAPGFQEQLDRELAAINASSGNADVLDWCDAMASDVWKDLD